MKVVLSLVFVTVLAFSQGAPPDSKSVNNELRELLDNLLGKRGGCGAGLSCGDGSCYSQTQKCDGFKHCDSAADEVGCQCDLWEVTCAAPSRPRCSDPQYACAGFNQGGCDDSISSNTVFCADPCEADGKHKCDYSEDSWYCAPKSWVCDGMVDCLGGNDEHAGCPVQSERDLEERKEEKARKERQKALTIAQVQFKRKLSGRH